MQRKKPDVHFFEAFDEEQQAIKRALPPGLEAQFHRETIQESGLEFAPARLLCIRTQSRVPDEWLASLDGVLSRSTGFDHLVRAARQPGPGPAFGHLSEYCSRAVAEHAVLVAGSLLRRLPRQCRHVSTFLRSGLTGQEMRGRHLVVAGVGRIGSEVARLGLALHMNVTGCDPVQRHDWLSYRPLDEALSLAEVLVCTMNLTAENRGLFDRARLSRLPRGAMVVNVARGELIVLQDLLSLYDEERVVGIGLDVFPDEAILAAGLRNEEETASNPELGLFRELMQRDNVILTPHNAFNTEESLAMKVQETLAELEHFRTTGRFRTSFKLPHEEESA